MNINAVAVISTKKCLWATETDGTGLASSPAYTRETLEHRGIDENSADSSGESRSNFDSKETTGKRSVLTSYNDETRTWACTDILPVVLKTVRGIRRDGTGQLLRGLDRLWCTRQESTFPFEPYATD